VDQETSDDIEKSDLLERNAFGSFDRLVINAAITVASIVPTVVTGLVLPWKLTSLICTEQPSGRKGLLLSPGLFFIVAILGSVFLAGASYTPPAKEINTQQSSDTRTSFFGLQESIDVARAVSDGQFSKAFLVITPLFLVAVFCASVSLLARPLLGVNWTITTAIRCWLYALGVAVGLIFIMFAALEFFDYRHETNKPLSGDVPMLVFFIYYFASIFTKGFKASLLRTAGSTLICTLSFVATMVSVSLLIQ
jgi:hypothetical protein